MKMSIPAEDDQSETKYILTFETSGHDEFVDVRLGIPHQSAVYNVTVSVSDLAAVVTVLEKVRDDGWKRERDLR